MIQGNILDTTRDMHYIFPNKSNQSCDLRFMLNFRDYFKKFNVKITYNTPPYGTPEIVRSGIGPEYILYKQINNIHDAKKIIEQIATDTATYGFDIKIAQR
jgi:hypothetical protein